MKKLLTYCGERIPVIDEETGLPTGEFRQPDGAPIVEGEVDLTPEEIAEIEAERVPNLKAAKRAAVSALLDAKLSGGYEHDFGEPYGVKKLQTRNIEDRTNWLTSQASYGAAIAAGAGAVMGANFRTEDNININLSYSDGHAVLLAMAQWGAAKYAKSWALKDAIAEAADEAALDAIDIESGW